jgi:CRP-like cAMP-binding protein
MHSGTWIGEMNFLDWAWEQNQPATLQVSPRKLEKQNDASKASDSVRTTESASSTTNVHQLNVQQKEAIPASAAATTTITQPKEDADNPKHKLVESLYTIVAKEDCVVWRWSFDEMQQLMNRSTDMRGALSRAMTTAITAKVVNLTLNRATHLPTWTTWLSDWTREDGASIRLRRIQTLPEDANNYDDGTGSGEGQDKQPQLPP